MMILMRQIRDIVLFIRQFPNFDASKESDFVKGSVYETVMET